MGTLRDALRSLQAFSLLPDSALESFLPFSRMRRLRAGETVFCQGEPSPYCFGVVSGEVLISWVAKDGLQPPVEIGILKPGELFGESAMLSDSPRAAMASARLDGELVVIQGPALRTWVESHPKEGLEFMMTMMSTILFRFRTALPQLCLRQK